ncbi:hypothetical protein GCM10028807_36330 [Spirosoma daeguense]
MEFIKTIEYLTNSPVLVLILVALILTLVIKSIREAIIHVILICFPHIKEQAESERVHKTLKSISIFFIVLSVSSFIFVTYNKKSNKEYKKDLYTDEDGNKLDYSISKITIEFNTNNITDTIPLIRRKFIVQAIGKANENLKNKYPIEWINLIKKDIDKGLLQKSVRDSLPDSFFTKDFRDNHFMKINEMIEDTNSKYTYSVSISLAKGSNIKAIIDDKCKEEIKKTILNRVTKNCVTTIGFDELYSGCSKNWYFLPYVSGCKQGKDCGKVYFESGQYNPAPFSQVVCECISDIINQYKLKIYISGYTDPDSIIKPLRYDGKGFYYKKAGIFLNDTTDFRAERIPDLIKTNLQLSYARAYSLYKLIKSNESDSSHFYTGFGIKTSETNYLSMRTVVIQFKCK